MGWGTLFHTVIQGPRLMEVLLSSTWGFNGYLNVPCTINPQQAGEREKVEGSREGTLGQSLLYYLTTFRQMGWGWVRNVDPCRLLPSHNSASWKGHTAGHLCVIGQIPLVFLFTCGSPITYELLGGKSCTLFNFVSLVPSILEQFNKCLLNWNKEIVLLLLLLLNWVPGTIINA